MTTDELSKLVFDSSMEAQVARNVTGVVRMVPTLATVRNHHAAPHHEVVPISSSSSTCTRESDASDAEGNPTGPSSRSLPAAATPPCAADQVSLDRTRSDQINAKVSQSKTSRQGRGSQRWVTASTGSLPSGSDHDDVAAMEQQIRLVTGCVPILKGGKILLVSASRKAEWILPKGGWETDEAMEESAIREVFEEAGVLGVLGPRLAEVQYETRKSKKRRLEQAEMLEKKLKKTEESTTDSEERATASVVPLPAAPVASEATASTTAAPISREDLTRIRSFSQECAPRNNCDDTASCTSGHSSAYSQVRMTLFPLYVSKVLASWPEEGRFRMAVDIDKAIEMQASRPEFKAALMEVKERGLHLVA